MDFTLLVHLQQQSVYPVSLLILVTDILGIGWLGGARCLALGVAYLGFPPRNHVRPPSKLIAQVAQPLALKIKDFHPLLDAVIFA